MLGYQFLRVTEKGTLTNSEADDLQLADALENILNLLMYRSEHLGSLIGTVVRVSCLSKIAFSV